MASRRLVVFFDGTWNTPDGGENPTNVVKLLRAVTNRDGDTSQITFYDKGVGTGGLLDRIAGGASGVGLTENMIDGYRFLGNNYEHDDEIYIFGFSRGAYTARSLAGFIGLAGLISPLQLGSGLQRAMDIYRSESCKEEKREQIERLGLDRHRDVRIRCIGVWDTVGALGIPTDLGRRLTGKRYYFQDVQLSDLVDVALHAVAIDEKRSAFAPTLWVRSRDEPLPAEQVVEQVWFPGVHSNVGGSYADAGLSDVALDWMLKRIAEHTDLAVDSRYVADHVHPDASGKGVESRSPLYKGSVVYPYQRLIGQTIPDKDGFGAWFRKRFRSLDRRNIPPEGLVSTNELLHVAALERCAHPVVHDCPEDRRCAPSDYRPDTLVAAIHASRRDYSIPVVGWDGSVLPRDEVPWPDV